MVARKPKTLQRSSQFRTCYTSGKKVVCQYVVVFFLEPGGDDGLQVGVVASKKVGNAVRRSRAKRLLREASRALTDRLNDRNIWVVLVAKATIIAQTSHAVRDDLEQGLARSGLI